MKKISLLVLLCFCSNVNADFNTGDTFGKGIVIQANGVNQTGGGRTINFSSGTTVTNNGNVYNITSSGTGPGALWTESGTNTYSKTADTVTTGTSSTSLDTFTVQTSTGGETINFTPPNSATGGNISTINGNEIHTFTGSGTFTPNFTGTVSVLVVGGGASGGTFGGGAAGGYRTNSSYAVTANSGITVTIGQGGTGVATSKGHSGGDTTFGTITSTGGGAGGGGATAAAPATGGSGGGGGQNDDNSNQTGAAGNTPSTSPSQGNNGGTANHSGGSQAAGGGGGGSGAVGANASGATTAGNGGVGTANSISGASVTYACGGGGGAYNFGGTGTKGTGGCASAGNGGVNGTTSTSASDNSGSGGGGQGLDSSGNGQGATSGAGGSGVVIVSFSVAATPWLRLDSAGTQTAKLWTNGASNNDVNLDVGTTTRFSLNGTTGKPTFSALTTNAPMCTSGSVGAADSCTVTGSGSSVLATSPVLVTPTLGVATGTSLSLGTSTTASALEVGSTTAGLNGRFYSTLGAEQAATLVAGNWTQGTGWASPIAGGVLDKNADGTGTNTPSAATNIVSGTTYQVSITVSVWSVGSATYTLGGVQGANTILAATTYTEYITATSTGKLVISPSNTSRFTISAISIKPLTSTTGALTIDGTLKAVSPADFTISGLTTKNVKIGGSTSSFPMWINATSIMQAQLADGSNMAEVDGSYFGAFDAVGGHKTLRVGVNPAGLEMVSNYDINWSNSTTSSSSTVDTSLSRISAGVVAVGAGSSGSTAGELRVNLLGNPNNAIAAVANAATVPVTSTLSTVTNNSAAGLTITITTTGAVDGQVLRLRVYDATNAAQTLTLVNTENSTVTAPANTNGSTSLPLTLEFMFNSQTTKWRLIRSV